MDSCHQMVAGSVPCHKILRKANYSAHILHIAVAIISWKKKKKNMEANSQKP